MGIVKTQSPTQGAVTLVAGTPTQATDPVGRDRFGKMVAVLAHELRNPLASAMAGLAAVAEMTEASDPRHAFVERAFDDLERVSELMDRYLDFGCQGTLQREPVDLVGLAVGLERRYGERIVVIPDTDRVIVQADAPLLERVLENLVDNAIEAGATRVQLDVGRESDGAVVMVTDNGPGVSRDLDGRLFEPFVSGRGGCGLGLALVAEVVDALDGSISLPSSASGACFRITLP